MVRDWPEAGIAVVIQDCRGTFASDGTFQFYVDEAADGIATRAWLANQPWCDGLVGTFGGSYVSITQYTAALADPDGLAAMETTVAPSTFDDDLAMRGGVPVLACDYEWAAQRVGDAYARRGQEPPLICRPTTSATSTC